MRSAERERKMTLACLCTETNKQKPVVRKSSPQHNNVGCVLRSILLFQRRARLFQRRLRTSGAVEHIVHQQLQLQRRQRVQIDLVVARQQRRIAVGFDSNTKVTGIATYVCQLRYQV